MNLLKVKDAKLTTKFFNDLLDSLVDDGQEVTEFSKCESPIEQVMYLALADLLKYLDDLQDRYMAQIECQKKVENYIHSYRVDICVNVCDLTTMKHYDFVIECDGHEFHEKTKEQVRKDRQRERNLMYKGYTVIRFAGSEIYENPSSCAIEAWKIMRARIEEQ